MNEQMSNEYFISTDKSLLNINMVHLYLSVDSYWAKNIPLHVLKVSIENSVCFGVYLSQQQVGFGRVVTDKATFAYLADVFILESHRGKGLSKLLMEAVMSYPELQGLRRWMLGTWDAHGLYTQFGWQALTNPERFMQLHNHDIYL